MWDKPLPLRPHHGLCMAFFQGKGYSSSFTAALAERLRDLESTDRPIRLTVGTDAVCAPCPHNRDGICDAAAQVAAYDQAVLALCGLEDGAVCNFSSFTQLVQSRILDAGRRREICGGCQWDSLCSATVSRWCSQSTP